MPRKSRKVLKSKGEAAPTKRSRKVVNFDLAPEELARAEVDLQAASEAGGVPITLAAFAKSATLGYGGQRRKLQQIASAIERCPAAGMDLAQTMETIAHILEGA